MKKPLSFIARVLLMTLAFVTGASSGVMMADASSLPDAGITEGGDVQTAGPKGGDGIATETFGRENADADLYMNDVDQRIIKIRPMATPIDQISRHAKAQSTDSFVVKYYSVGTREIKCTLTEDIAAMTSGASTVLTVDDPNMFTIDDTIRVVGVSGITKPDGTAYTDADSIIPDLVLCVCGVDDQSNLPVVYAVNGKLDSIDTSTLVSTSDLSSYVNSVSASGTAPLTLSGSLSSGKLTLTGSIATATTSALGAVKVTTGNGLALSSGAISMTAASTSAAGAMSSTDKTKLDALEEMTAITDAEITALF